MKKRKKVILISIVVMLVILSMTMFIIENFDGFTVTVIKRTDCEILAKSVKNDKYYCILLSETPIINKKFEKLDISDLKEGYTIYVLNETPRIKDAIAITTKEGYSIEENLSYVKLIILNN